MGDTLPKDSPRDILIDETAKALIAEWERVEGPVNASYVANFADMAKVMVERFAPEPDLPDFMVGNQLVDCANLDTVEYTHESHNVDTDDITKANLISSKVKGKKAHKPIFDLDSPAALIPSSTPGHFHLYLDKELSEEQMGMLVNTLWQVGLIAEGNLNQWDRFRGQFLRLPWVKKKVDSTDDTPKE